MSAAVPARPLSDLEDRATAILLHRIAELDYQGGDADVTVHLASGAKFAGRVGRTQAGMVQIVTDGACITVRPSAIAAVQEGSL